MKLISIVRSVLIFLSASLCTNAYAATHGVPLSPEDRGRLDQSFTLTIPWTPRLAQPIDGHPVILGAVLFDGTRNDRLNVPSGERQTIVAHLHDQLRGNESVDFVRYYPGAGTQLESAKALLDSAIGYSVQGTVNQAVGDVMGAIDEARSHKPDAEVRLFVSGFSRGSAAARHFMNVFERRWLESNSDNPLRFYAIVFDTVATGQRTKLFLQVPKSADLFYHFVSVDERRLLFKPVIDLSRDVVAGRVVTIPIPGVHSDVGASYARGIGSEYLANIDALLSGMGLLPAQCFDVSSDARAEGKNDSRWMIERLRGIGAPNTAKSPASRDVFYVATDPVPDDFWPDWRKRMQALEFDGNFSIARCVKRTEIWMPEFRVTRRRGSFVVQSLPPIILPSARIISEGDGYFLTYTFDGNTLSKAAIPLTVLNKISEGSESKLSLAVVRDGAGGYHFYWYLNGVITGQIEGTFHDSN